MNAPRARTSQRPTSPQTVCHVLYLEHTVAHVDSAWDDQQDAEHHCNEMASQHPRYDWWVRPVPPEEDVPS